MITAAISGSAMTFVVLVLRTVFLHKLPKWLFRCLWILVAIRFMLPFSLALRVEVKVPTYISDTVILSQIPTDADNNYAAGGTVIYAGYDYENGNMVTISHDEGYVTYYSHLEAYDCKEGDKVLAGDRIASVGATGSVTGANLGFSIMVDGGYIDPTPLFE